MVTISGFVIGTVIVIAWVPLVNVVESETKKDQVS